MPEPGDPSSPSGQGFDAEDRALLEKVEAGFETVGALYNACKFRAALGEALALAREANGYLDRKAPWFQIKEDPAAAATTVYVILRAVDNLKTILAPILPHTPGLRGAALRHSARGRVRRGGAFSPGADLRSQRRGGHLDGERAAGGAGAARAGAVVQEVG